MPSHAYFFDSTNQPDWDSEPPPDTLKLLDRRRMIADAIVLAFPEAVEMNWRALAGCPLIELALPGIEIVVDSDYLHLRLRWRGFYEMADLRLTYKLHRLANVVNEVAGFDFFEHGCQGLGVRGDIELVPYVISGMRFDFERRLKSR